MGPFEWQTNAIKKYLYYCIMGISFIALFFPPLFSSIVRGQQSAGWRSFCNQINICWDGSDTMGSSESCIRSPTLRLDTIWPSHVTLRGAAQTDLGSEWTLPVAVLCPNTLCINRVSGVFNISSILFCLDTNYCKRNESLGNIIFNIYISLPAFHTENNACN